MKINLISESDFTVQGHGVHTAFVEMRNMLQTQDDVDLGVNTFRRADITHIHTAGAYSVLHLLRGGKKVISAHVVPDSFVGSLRGAKTWLPLAKMYLRWFYNRADMVLAVSEETKADLQKLGVSKPITVMHNTIDTSKYVVTDEQKRHAKEELSMEETVVIGAGQVQPRKRIDSFIAAAKELPDIRFVWVGGMPFGKAAADHGEMERMIETAPGNVTFTGIVPLEKMRLYYAAADIFWLPSDQETFGLVVVEAAASGLPVVLRNIPDYDETFKGDAVLCDETEFAPAILRLATDKKWYQQLRLKADNIAARFDSTKNAGKLIDIYRSLLD